MQCTTCRQVSPPTAKFCFACGARLLQKPAAANGNGGPPTEVIFTKWSLAEHQRIAAAKSGVFRFRCSQPIPSVPSLNGATLIVDCDVADGVSMAQGMTAGRLELSQASKPLRVQDLGHHMQGGEIVVKRKLVCEGGIGESMTGGLIRIKGSVAGRLWHIGKDMAAGGIQIEGDVEFERDNGHLGYGMTGGDIHVQRDVTAGSAFDLQNGFVSVGYNMDGGAITIDGDVVSTYPVGPALDARRDTPLIIIGDKMSGFIQINGSVRQPRECLSLIHVATDSKPGATLSIGRTCYPARVLSGEAGNVEIDGVNINLDACACGGGYGHARKTLWALRARGHYVCNECEQARAS